MRLPFFASPCCGAIRISSRPAASRSTRPADAAEIQRAGPGAVERHHAIADFHDDGTSCPRYVPVESFETVADAAVEEAALKCRFLE